MKTLAQYLAEYLDTEFERSSRRDMESLWEWIVDGIGAYESTENCSIGIVGGDCPDCGAMMQKGESVLYTGRDEVEVVSYLCPECGYVVYG